MTPYYSDSAVTIYHGDCREILPDLPKVDLVLTDPPYASAAATVTTGWGKHKHGGNWGDMSLVGLMAEATLGPAQWPSQVLWFTDHLAYAAIVPVLFRHYQLVQSIVWDRDVLGMGAHFRKQTEFIIYARTPEAPRLTDPSQRDIIRLRPPRKVYHPAEKPLGLINRLLSPVDAGTILDPYCGSGTTLLSARIYGRKAIGIEIEEKYCEIAAQRMAQEVLDL